MAMQYRQKINPSNFHGLNVGKPIFWFVAGVLAAHLPMDAIFVGLGFGFLSILFFFYGYVFSELSAESFVKILRFKKKLFQKNVNENEPYKDTMLLLRTIAKSPKAFCIADRKIKRGNKRSIV